MSRLAHLPATHVVALSRRQATVLDPDGEIRTMGLRDTARLVRREPVMLCHAVAAARRLGIDPVPAYDLLELFAFARPARFCLPTPRGVAAALGHPLPTTPEDEPQAVRRAAAALLGGIGDRDAADIAAAMGAGGWLWAPYVLSALGADAAAKPAVEAFRVWARLPQWEERAPPAPPGSRPIAEDAIHGRLADLVGDDAETRDEQAQYAAHVGKAFDPRPHPDAPIAVLAEAGTGVGKTLGYIAPASLWAELNSGAVWFSTYTRNLQNQIDQELDRLYPDPEKKDRAVVVRKGRENYFCLLNFEERTKGVATRPQDAIALGLIARWTAVTRDGDLTGGDFPAWLVDLLGHRLTLGLADRRGECIYAACPHYRACFIEHTVRRARRAKLVVANHALVLVQAALGGGEDMRRVTRFVFDEGHHLFEAADSAFSANLSGREGADLRRWLLGAEQNRQSRARGLRRRIEDIVAGDDETEALLRAATRAARILPAAGWRQRIEKGEPVGPAEAFLADLRRVIYARSDDPRSPYTLEADAMPADAELSASAARLERALSDVRNPLARLHARLLGRLDDDAAEMDTDTRRRIEAVCRTLTQRAIVPLDAWRDMLASLAEEKPMPSFVDWFAIDRYDGRDIDAGFRRHWRDPMVPFAETVGRTAHGLVVTSATLRDGTGNADDDWAAAEARTGTQHLDGPVFRAAISSPFDYRTQSRVLIVTDVRKNDIDQVAAAYRELFQASRGGALGLFTAIARLRAVHKRIVDPLEDAGLMVLAQHVDPMNTATLVEMFRAEPDACLLGTDAVRDGVDVPGESLRLIVFDRVPWPRRSILHRERRIAFGGDSYDDMLTRLRLKQAFGRLIRRAGDRGVFVMLDSALPSRLCGAFPEDAPLMRLGLRDAIAEIRSFAGAELHPDEQEA